MRHLEADLGGDILPYPYIQYHIHGRLDRLTLGKNSMSFLGSLAPNRGSIDIQVKTFYTSLITIEPPYRLRHVSQDAACQARSFQD